MMAYAILRLVMLVSPDDVLAVVLATGASLSEETPRIKRKANRAQVPKIIKRPTKTGFWSKNELNCKLSVY